MGDIWDISDGQGASWIFPETEADAVNQIVDFLHIFDCAKVHPDAELLISADTDFVVWLNGSLVGHGQYSDYPDQKTYERFNVTSALRAGSNTIAITVFYNGRNSSVYRRGAPGLLFEIRSGELLTASGTATLCRQNRCYCSGPIATVSGQLFYTFGYDARGHDGFNCDSYRPGSDWSVISNEEATIPKERLVLLPRPVSRLLDGGTTESQLIEAGYYRRDISEAESEFESSVEAQTSAGLLLQNGKLVSAAWLMQHSERVQSDVEAELSEGQDGIYMIYDMGREEAGHLVLDIEAPAGTVLDIGYGEHLDDKHVRTWIGGRNFAARYICCEGRQGFTHHFQRWAGRYLEIHVDGADFSINSLVLHRHEYPVECKGKLDTGNDLHRRIIEVGCRTLFLCMHEHYEDTPWREQALYANDARTQALCGYYAFGEYDFPASSFSLLGRGLRDDGFLMLTAPAAPPVTIPSFTLVWMLAVRDHFLYSGDDRLAKKFLPQIRSMLKRFLSERVNGLWQLRQAKGVWHFYDWTEGMSRYTEEDFAKGLKEDAPFNCVLVLAIEAARDILRWFGEDGGDALSEAADEIRAAIADRFWDKEEGLFENHKGASSFSELTQALAVLARAGTDDMRTKALSRMARKDSGLVRPSLSQSFYTFEALMTQKDLYGDAVLADIEDTWGKMLDAGATTFWETIKGASDFSNAGSLCHGWSAVPLYVYFHDLLGVRPLEPGYRTFAIDPIVESLPSCSGLVHVPDGEINLSWENSDAGLQYNVDCPESCHALPADKLNQ